VSGLSFEQLDSWVQESLSILFMDPDPNAFLLDVGLRCGNNSYWLFIPTDTSYLDNEEE
jgi:hypothetical protein